MARRQKEQKLRIVGEETAIQTVAPRQLPQPEISFDQWWLQISGQKRLSPELKEAIRQHFQARGFHSYKDFNLGLADFGVT